MRRLVGVLAYSIPVYIAVFFLFFVSTGMMQISIDGDLAVLIDFLHLLVALLGVGLIVLFGMHVLRNADLTAGGRVAWILGLLLLGAFAIPKYYRAHFRHSWPAN